MHLCVHACMHVYMYAYKCSCMHVSCMQAHAVKSYLPLYMHKSFEAEKFHHGGEIVLVKSWAHSFRKDGIC